jgi:hypothetical protein
MANASIRTYPYLLCTLLANCKAPFTGCTPHLLNSIGSFAGGCISSAQVLALLYLFLPHGMGLALAGARESSDSPLN